MQIKFNFVKIDLVKFGLICEWPFELFDLYFTASSFFIVNLYFSIVKNFYLKQFPKGIFINLFSLFNFYFDLRFLNTYDYVHTIRHQKNSFSG